MDELIMGLLKQINREAAGNETETEEVAFEPDVSFMNNDYLA